MESKVTWLDGMAFDAELEGFSCTIDADPEFGGEERGPKPKGLTLMSLAGCTAMDVIAILKKMRVEPTSFAVDARSELTDDHPKVFEGITLTYDFEGEDLPADRLLRAIELSLDRYCGVTAMLREAVPIRFEAYLNGEELEPVAA